MSSKVTSPFAPSGLRASVAKTELKPFSWGDASQRNAWIAAMASAVMLVWAYWLMFNDAAAEWDQPQYSHGWVLPLIALYIMWSLRPNKAPNAKVETALRGVAILGVVLIAVGYNFAALGFLQGIGLAVGCLGGLGCVLWGQPFATLASGDSESLRFNQPEVLWGVAAAGCGICTLGLLGIGLGPLSPDVFSMLGLMIVIIGLILLAAFAPPSPVITWHEVGVGVLIMLFCSYAWAMGVLYDRMPLAQVSFIATAIGVLAVVGGMNLVRWVGPPVAFLMFMFPLPAIMERSVLGALQKIAVVLSEMVYTIIGIPAIREGSQIRLPSLGEDIQMEIAEACSGLSMSNILIAMCVGIAIVMRRPWWDKLIVLLSALPIAIISNVFRIVVTGLIWMAMDRFVGGDSASVGEFRDTIHTWIGLIVMMPFALGLLMLELKLLSSLSVPEESTLDKSQVLGRGTGVPVR